ncbi:MAG: adenylate/guanylate cyclase domain-containing protein [Acidobacteria bacterium]|nr:adenylate/guanylate cyclase domain-containing protein [Acidobacteriota bacterium]
MTEIAYAPVVDSNVAFRVTGEPGGVDVVMVSGAFFPFEMLEEDRVGARFMAGLSSLGRLVVFDKRGVGLSDPITDWTRSVQEQWAEDLCAVVEYSGLKRALVVSWEPMGVARLAASLRPELFGSMALVNPASFTSGLADLLSTSGEASIPTRSVEEMAFPSRIQDPDFNEWLQRAGRSGASPATAARMWGHILSYQAPLTPAGIGMPTLVLHNRDCMSPERSVRAVADEIRGASFVQIPGQDTYPIAGDVDALLAEIAQFVTGAPSDLAPQRALAAVLFTDLVDSTQRAVDVGDAAWRHLLDLHDKIVDRYVLHHGGRVVKYTGDGVLALLPSATAALATAESIRAELAERDLQIRAGVHVGDVDVRGDDVSGLTVNIAARIMGVAEGGETLVSDTVCSATLGSGLDFGDARTTQLKGIPEPFVLHRWVR